MAQKDYQWNIMGKIMPVFASVLSALPDCSLKRQLLRGHERQPYLIDVWECLLKELLSLT